VRGEGLGLRTELANLKGLGASVGKVERFEDLIAWQKARGLREPSMS
jgi:hypothetical protein